MLSKNFQVCARHDQVCKKNKIKYIYTLKGVLNKRKHEKEDFLIDRALHAQLRAILPRETILSHICYILNLHHGFKYKLKMIHCWSQKYNSQSTVIESRRKRTSNSKFIAFLCYITLQQIYLTACMSFNDIIILMWSLLSFATDRYTCSHVKIRHFSENSHVCLTVLSW